MMGHIQVPIRKMPKHNIPSWLRVLIWKYLKLAPARLFRMEDIDSESVFVWKFLFHVIITPITIILVLFGKKEPSSILQPFIDLFRFFTRAKAVMFLVLANVLASVSAWYLLSADGFENLVSHTTDLFVPSRYYSFISSGFIHADLSHLLWNMLALFIFGRVVEKKLGMLKTFGIYMCALLFATISTHVMHLLDGTSIGLLGASGAIMGILGAAMLLDPFYITYELIIPLPVMVVGWITIYGDITGVLTQTNDGISHIAHLAGFKSVSTGLYMMGERESLKKGFIINIISLALAIGLYFLVGFGIVPGLDEKDIKSMVSSFV
jgi:membrane associated rhomboid family serine protease